MARANSWIIPAWIGVVTLMAAVPACAQDGWLAQELARLSAVPHTLQGVSGNAWFQIPVRDQRIHAVPDDAYREARVRLDALASAARPALERELGGVLSSLRYDDLRATAARQPLSYCSWIGTTRPDGMLPSASDLQATLLARCRPAAARVVTTILNERADALDLSLPALPHLDLAFPRWLLADLAESDASGSFALDPLQLQTAYQDRVTRRIAAASPGLQTSIDRAYAARTWQGGLIDRPDTNCRNQLGPLATSSLGSFCRDVATRWIGAQLPAMTRALPGAIAATLAAHPTADAAGLCTSALSAWLPATISGAILGAPRDACLPEARRALAQAAADRAQAIADAIDARVTQVAAPVLAAPRTYDSLRGHQWFAQPVTAWDGIVAAGNADAPAVRERAQTEYGRRIAPAGDAALAHARQQIEVAYQHAAGRASGIRETQRLCGPDGRGTWVPSAPIAGSLRDRVVALCVAAYETFKVERVRIALDRAGIRRDDRTVLVVVGESDARLLLRTLISEAAMAGLQVRVNNGMLGLGAGLVVTPIGAEAPRLSGTVSRTAEGLRLAAIDPLPGWSADPHDTVLCLMADESDLTGAQFSAAMTVFGSFLAFDSDLPRTAGSLMREGFSRMQDVQNLRACLAARQTFIDQAPGG